MSVHIDVNDYIDMDIEIFLSVNCTRNLTQKRQLTQKLMKEILIAMFLWLTKNRKF